MADFSDLFAIESSSQDFNKLWEEIEAQQFSPPSSPPSTRSSPVKMSSSVEPETKPSLLKTLLGKAGKSESTHTPFKEITAPENFPKLTTGPVIEEKTNLTKTGLPFKRYSTCTTTMAKSVATPTCTYSPPLDENWPPSHSFINAEDSILTTIRRTNKKKLRALETRFTQPRVTEELKILRNLQTRIVNDVTQSQIIVNYLCDNYAKDEPEKKRVKFSSVE